MKMNKIKYVYSSCSLICGENEFGKNCLLLGDAQGASSLKTLAQHKIKSVLSIGEQTFPAHKLKGTAYYTLSLRDQHSENASKYFEWAFDIIEKGREEGNVYVHCYHGVSRSATFVIAYLMRKGGMGYEQGYQWVKARRPCIGPNEGFVKQLRIYEEVCKGDKKQQSK